MRRNTRCGSFETLMGRPMSTRTCPLPGCKNKHYGKSLCRLHWKRKWRTGTTELTIRDNRDESGRLLPGARIYVPPKGISSNSGRTHFKKGMTPWNKGARKEHRDLTVMTFICEVCGASFSRVPRARGNPRTCSRSCFGKLRSGSNHHNWKGGVTAEHERLRKTARYAQWRVTVFQRDDFTCQMCDKRGGRLHADHIQPFATNPALRLELSNGRTLCVQCHRATPTWGSVRVR